jgi:hypothetical protein
VITLDAGLLAKKPVFGRSCDGCTVFLWYKRDWWYQSCSIVLGNTVLKLMGSCVQCMGVLCIVVKGVLL